MPSLCPECNSPHTRSRTAPFAACQDCGKLYVESQAEQVAQAPPPTPPSPQPGGLVVETVVGEVQVPDYTEVMVGWRAWGVDPEDPDCLLHSVTQKTQAWTPRAPMEAKCLRRGRGKGKTGGGHEVPDWDCSCGLYSAKSLPHLLSMGYHQYDAERRGMWHVVGSVNLWGKIVEGSQGWRAQNRLPEDAVRALTRPGGSIEGLHDQYGVEVKLLNFLKEDQQVSVN